MQLAWQCAHGQDAVSTRLGATCVPATQASSYAMPMADTSALVIARSVLTSRAPGSANAKRVLMAKASSADLY